MSNDVIYSYVVECRLTEFREFLFITATSPVWASINNGIPFKRYHCLRIFFPAPSPLTPQAAQSRREDDGVSARASDTKCLSPSFLTIWLLN